VLDFSPEDDDTPHDDWAMTIRQTETKNVNNNIETCFGGFTSEKFYQNTVKMF